MPVTSSEARICRESMIQQVDNIKKPRNFTVQYAAHTEQYSRERYVRHVESLLFEINGPPGNRAAMGSFPTGSFLIHIEYN